MKESNDDVRALTGSSYACAVKIWLKIALNVVRFCAREESCVVFNTGSYTVLPDNSILITANLQSETGFPSSHQLKSYVASKSRLKLAARAVLSADAGLLVN